MNEFVAKWGNMKTDAADMTGIGQKLQQLVGDIEAVTKGINSVGSLRDYAGITTTCNNLKNTLIIQKNAVYKMGSVLESVADLYCKTEEELINCKITSPEKESETQSDIINLSLLTDLVKSTGNVPASAAPYLRMMLSHATGEKIGGAEIADALITGSTSSFAFFFDVAENGGKVDWENVLKINPYMPKGTVPGKSFFSYFKTAIKSELDEFVDFSTMAKGSNAVAKWGGVVVEGISEGIENYEEYKRGEISGQRAVAETVIETAVDTVAGIAVTAAVGAGLAAGGIVAAPAIAVAAIGVGIVAGVNWGVEKLFGKDMGEWVSDLACDAGESIAGWFKKLGN